MANAQFDYNFKIPDSNYRMNPNNENGFSNQGAVYKGTNHMGKSLAYEPQRLYNFELQIVGIDSLYTADKPGTLGDVNDPNLIRFGSAAERILVACSSFSVPNTDFGQIEIPHYNNTTKYAGKVTFGDATLVIEQFLGSFTEQIMTTWARCVYDPRTQNIGYKNDYAKDVYVIQYDSKGGTPRVWKLENAWPNVLPGAEWSYDSTDRRKMSYTLKCDRCVPDYGIDTRTFKSVMDSSSDINSITQRAIEGASISTPLYANKNATINNYGTNFWKYDENVKAYVNANNEYAPAMSTQQSADGNDGTNV